MRKSVEKGSTEEMEPEERTKRAKSTPRGVSEVKDVGPGVEVNETDEGSVGRAKRANSTVPDLQKDDKVASDVPIPIVPAVEMCKMGCPFRMCNSVPFLVALMLCMMVVLHRKYNWVARMWSISGEGHSVSKFVVILFFLYLPSFVLWFRDFGLLVGVHLAKCRDGSLDHLNLMKRIFPELHGRVEDWAGQRLDAIQQSYAYNFLVKAKNWAKVFYAPYAVITGLKIWDFVWTAFVCKGSHDKSCTNSWIGLMLYNYRLDMCNDEKTSFIMCEKLIAYLPLTVLAVVTVIMGNFVQNVINQQYEAFGRPKERAEDISST